MLLACGDGGCQPRASARRSNVLMLPPSRLGGRLIAAARSQFAIVALLAVGGIVVQSTITRRFGLSGLGEYTAVLLAVNVVTVVTMMSIPGTAGREVARAAELDGAAASRFSGAALTLALVLGALGATGLSLLWPQVAAGMQMPDPPSAAALWVAVFFSCLTSGASAVFRAHLQMTVVALVGFSQPLATLLTVISAESLPTVGPGQLAVVGFVAAGLATATALILSRHRPLADIDPVLALLRASVEGLPLVYANAFRDWIDRLAVSFIAGPLALGTYQAAAALVEGPIRFLRASGWVFVVGYARSSGDGERSRRLRDIQVRAVSVYSVVLAAALLAGGEGLIGVVYGPASGAAAGPLRLLAIAAIPTTLIFALLNVSLGMRRPSLGLMITGLAIALQIVVLPPLVVLGGVIGAALAQLALSLVVLLTVLLRIADPRARELLPRRDVSFRILGASILGVAAGMWIGTMPLPWPIRLAAAALAAGATAFGLLLGVEERALVRRLLADWG